ncbi:MAG: hypothetical protein LPJ87_10975 [Zoogloeaceae bacterium]|nr:hypothetical protein [Zoogloeaceae bacterium]
MRYPRAIVVRASSRSFMLIAAIHLIAAISFVHLLFEPGWVAAGVCLLATSFGLSWWVIRRNAISCIELGDDGLLRFPDRDGEGRPCGRLADFGLVRWLEWREGRRRVALMLWRSECSADDWRALGVWLRHKTAMQEPEFSDAA